MTGEPILSVEQISIAFDDRAVVEQLSFEIARGEILALVGESGSGKTIAARSLLGLLPYGARVTGGRALYRGSDLFRLDEPALRAVRGVGIAMVFQEPMTSLDPSMKIGRQMAEALKFHEQLDDSACRERMIEMLTRVRIADPSAALDSYPHQFSGGMRQRISVASAMLLRPTLLIADEPTTALDVIVQKDVLDLLVELVRETGTSVLLITHDLGLVAEYSDQIVVMQKGRLVEAGSTEKVLRAPTQDYTRTLLAASPRREARLSSSAPREKLLEIDRLNVSFAGPRKWPWLKSEPVRPVNDISLGLRRGETMAIVGESGSGKTTLARAILGLVPIESGYILFDGADVTSLDRQGLADFRRRAAIVFQDPFSALDPRQRVGASIGEGLRHEPGLGRAERLQRIGASLAEVGLDESFIDRFPHQLSGGQRQRVNIARALISDPELVIADEPVSALDVTVQAEILKLFDALQKARGFACLFVSHGLGVVEQIADRVTVIYRGRIVEEGSRDEVFDSPRHPYTCALLRAAPRIQSDGQSGYRLSPYAAEVRPPPDGRDYLPWGGSGVVDAETELVPVTGSHRVACLSQAKVQS